MQSLKDEFELMHASPDFLSFCRKISSCLSETDSRSILDIQKLLQEKNVYASKDAIQKAIVFSQVTLGNVLRSDSYQNGDKYLAVDSYRRKSNYTKFYYDLNLDHCDQILVISDTHIGNTDMEDFSLIHCIYDYAAKKGISTIIHLGDLFEGVKNTTLSSDDIEEMNRQINLFIEKYPHPYSSEIKTYALVGNHDKLINDYLEQSVILNGCDLRTLTYYDPSFYMFPYRNIYQSYSTSEITTQMDNLTLHLSHFLYISYMVSYHPIDSLEDLTKFPANLFLDTHSDFLLSGHIHKGFVYTNSLPENEHDLLYVSVPSLSKMNQNQTCAYVLTFHRNDFGKVASLDITSLNVDSNDYVTEQESFHHDFETHHKILKKIL